MSSKTMHGRTAGRLLALGLACATLAACGATSSSGTDPTPTGTAPMAAFTSRPASPVAGQSVQFTDASTGTPTAWSWSFGDGGTSTAQNPTHPFAAAGTYTVTLAAANAAGSNTTTRTVTVSGSTFSARFVRVPGGSFVMGDQFNFVDPAHPTDELPSTP